jgi:hypothetical protein
MVISGCVFFICTAGAGFGAGSGKTVIRAVSFFGPGDEAGDELAKGLVVGAAAPKTADPGPEVVGGAGLGGLGINGVEDGGGGTVARPEASLPGGEAGLGGKNGGGETGLAGGGGKGAWASGGRGDAGAPGDVGGVGGGALGPRDGVASDGGRAGKFIRTVSRLGLPASEDWLSGAGELMRTVSFFGSFGSAMKQSELVSRNDA